MKPQHRGAIRSTTNEIKEKEGRSASVNNCAKACPVFFASVNPYSMDYPRKLYDSCCINIWYGSALFA